MVLLVVALNPRWRRGPFWKISNGHISTTGHPIHFLFDSRVGFSGLLYLTVLILDG